MKAGSKSGNVLNALMKHPFREESAEADTDGGMVVAFHNEPPKNWQQKPRCESIVVFLAD